MNKYDIDQDEYEVLEQAMRSLLLTPVIEGTAFDDDDVAEFLTWRLDSPASIRNQVSASR